MASEVSGWCFPYRIRTGSAEFQGHWAMSDCSPGKVEVVLHVSGSVNIGYFVVQRLCNVFLSPLELLTSTQFQFDDCSF